MVEERRRTMVLQSGQSASWLCQGVLPRALVAALVCFFPAQGLEAGLYRCIDASGERMFTDSPVQVGSCQPLKFDVPPSGSKPLRAITTQPSRVPVSPSAPQAHAVTSPSAARKDVQITVPVQRVGHLLIVSTQVNGSRDARLILDTGSSHTILSHDVAGDLGLLSERQTRLVTLKTAGGPVEAELARMDSIRIADAEVRDSLVAIYDMPDAPEGVDGLLGLTFLQQFEVTLDAGQGLLHLRGSQP